MIEIFVMRRTRWISWIQGYCAPLRDKNLTTQISPAPDFTNKRLPTCNVLIGSYNNSSDHNYENQFSIFLPWWYIIIKVFQYKINCRSSWKTFVFRTERSGERKAREQRGTKICSSTQPRAPTSSRSATLQNLNSSTTSYSPSTWRWTSWRSKNRPTSIYCPNHLDQAEKQKNERFSREPELICKLRHVTVPD